MTPALRDLISSGDDGWSQLQEWIAASVRPVEFLSGDRSTGEATLLALQVTTRSMLGTIALYAGGILLPRPHGTTTGLPRKGSSS